MIRAEFLGLRIYARMAVTIVAVVLAIVSPVAAHPVAIDTHASTMTVNVHKKGLFSFLADDHAIEAPIANGEYDADAAAVNIVVDAAALKVFDPKLSADKRAQVQSAMVSSKVLDVERYPKIEFRSTKIERTGRKLKITGDLSLHGQTHPIVVTADEADSTHFTGSATIRQTEFGITPIKIGGGAVSVRDDVEVEFRIVLAG